MDKNDIKRLKKEVEDARQKLATLQGREEYLLERLKKEFGCKDLASARTKANGLKVKIKDTETRVQQAIEQLEAEYEIEN